MRSAGILLIVAGAFVLYAVVHGHLASPAQSSSDSSSSSSGKSGSGNTPDSGTHQGIDLTGLVTGAAGTVYTIAAGYADMTPQQQDDANAYAHQIGNVG